MQLGEEYSGIKPRGELQEYEQLKKFNLDHGTLFEDHQFVPETVDLGVKLKGEIQWLRPKVTKLTALLINCVLNILLVKIIKRTSF